MGSKTFEDMKIWQQSMNVACQIYQITSRGEFSKDFGLRDQLRRSAISISSNIAKGHERNNDKELLRFLSYAKASAGEARSQIHLAIRIGYIQEQRDEQILSDLKEISSSLSGFIRYIKRNNDNKI